MSPYPVNLPSQLWQEAEKCAADRGISLEEFILWAVADKVGSLSQLRHDPAFKNIIYRRGASGQLMPVLRGTALRVQTIAIAAGKWGLSPSQIAAEYDISEAMVNEALAFYADRRQEIDASIASEEIIEAVNV